MLQRRTAAAALCAALALAPPPAAALKIDAPEWTYLLPAAVAATIISLVPLMHTEGLPKVGFDEQPYREEYSKYAAGEKPWALSVRGGHQRTEGRRDAARAGARLTTAKRLGADVDWTRFEAGALRIPGRTDYLSAHVVGNLSEDEHSVMDWGVGAAALEGPVSRVGGSLSMSGEWFPRRPLTVHARYQVGILSDRRGYHDLSLHLGAVWGRLGVSAGGRAFLNPLRNSYGPEALLRLWL